jgi:hypothetical protein
MKSSALLLFLIPVTALASESRVQEVTVFKDRAFVTRARKVSLPQGASSISFGELTPLADLETLKATFARKSPVTILGIRTRAEFSAKSGNAELEHAISARKAAERKRDAITHEVSLLTQGNQNLELLSAHYRDSFSLNVHQNTWTKAGLEGFVRFLTTESDHINGAWTRLYAAFQANDQELELANARIAEATRASDRHGITVIVDVLAEAPAQTDLELQYLVTQCGWSPAYDLRIGELGTASVEQDAFVWQKSGEDWRDVTLTLSNLRAELRPQAPSISPYSLTYQEAGKVATTVSSAVDSAQSLTMGAGGGSEKRVFKVPGLQTVRDGMAQTRLFIARKDSTYTEKLELAAAEYDRAYRKGSATNPFDWEMEAGPASVYTGGSFVQQISLGAIAQGDHFAVNAGVDHDVVVTRTTQDKVEKPGILDTKQHFLRQVRLTLKSYGGSPKKLRVYEQIPVSEIKEVTVGADKSTPGLVADEKNPGWHYWDMALPTNEAKVVMLDLNVAVPSDFGFSWQNPAE